MPIKFLSDRRRAQRLGRIRLGVKKTNAQGKSYPSATPHFVLKDAEALKEFYGEQPTTLHIEFLWDHMEGTFPHYLRRYVKSGLRCLGDGEFIMYRVNKDKVKDVSDGHVIDPDGKAQMDDRSVWLRATCPGDQCPHYINGSCKPTGFLRFLPTEAPRLGYYDMVCHQRAIVGIKTQLELAGAIFGRITGIPFILHRGDPEKVPVKTPQGMKDMPIRTQWIEIDPDWVAENFARRDEQKALVQRTCKQDIAELFGEDNKGDEPLALPPGNDDFEEPTFEGEDGPGTIIDGETGEIFDDEPEDDPAPARDIDAIETLGDLWTACQEDFGLERSAALKELGVKKQEHLKQLPREMYQQIAEMRA